MAKYGVLAAEGHIEQEADECAVTGRPVLGQHSVMEQVGKSHFVRYLSHKAEDITAEMRASWYADCGEVPAAPEGAASAPEENTGRRSRQRRSDITEPPAETGSEGETS